MFFTRREELSQARFVPLIVDAMVDPGGTPTRPEVIARATEMGRFTPEELAVPSHTRQDRETGRGAVEGRLHYAIWDARRKGVRNATVHVDARGTSGSDGEAGASVVAAEA